MTRQTRRLLEIVMASYGWWWAANVAVDYALGRHPLWWIDVDRATGIAIAYAMAAGSVIAALGERINGRWRWSPILRSLGAAIMSAVMWLLAVRGAAETLTAWGTYSALGLLFAAAAWAALRDLGGRIHGHAA